MSSPLRELTRFGSCSLRESPRRFSGSSFFPVVLALVLGFAFKQRGVETVRVGVVNGETESAG